MTFLKNIRANIVPVLILISIAFGVIFYNFVDIPKNLHYDEVEFAKLALSLQGNNYIPYSPLATGHTTLYFYMLLFSLNLFGISTFALRLPSALFGVVNVLLVYVLMRLIFENVKNQTFIAFIVAFVFISMRWYFNFARFSFEVTFLLMLELMSLIFLFMYRKNNPTESEDRKLLWIGISGIFAGLAYNSYTAGRVFVLLPLTLILVDIIRKKIWPFTWKKLQPVLLFVIPFVILIMPITVYLSQNKDIRIYQLFMVMNDKMTIDEKIPFVWQNITSTLTMFNIRGDVNGVHNFPNKPALNPILGILFIAGFGISLWKWKKTANTVFLIYFFISLFPTFLVYPWENPHMLRTFTALPAVAYFIGVSIHLLIEKLGKKIDSKWIMAAVMMLIIASTVYELRTYFYYQAGVLEESFRKHKSLEFHLRQEGVRL